MGKEENITILIVDEDSSARYEIRDYLEEAGFKTIDLGSGKQAQQCLVTEKVDCVVADVRMREINGIELMHFIRRNIPGLPVVMTTSATTLLDEAEALAMGATSFLLKPIEDKLLIKTVRRIFFPEEELETKTVVTKDEEYCKLNIDDFITGSENKYDIYVRQPDGQYLRISQPTDSLAAEKIRALRTQGVQHLYMTREDFKRYISFNVQLGKVIAANDSIEQTKKLTFIKHTNELLLEYAHRVNIDERVFEDVHAQMETVVSTVVSQERTFDVINLLNSHADFIYAHNIGVSLYSLLIAKELKWKSPLSLFKIGLGGLLHDIGKKDIDRSILEKKKEDLTPEEKLIIETHPEKGYKMLAGLPKISSDVLDIVRQHHEDCLGTGYPFKLLQNQIHPMARLVSVANEFCNLALKNPQSQGMPPKKAITLMLIHKSKTLDQKFMTALIRALKLKGD